MVKTLIAIGKIDTEKEKLELDFSTDILETLPRIHNMIKQEAVNCCKSKRLSRI